MGCGITEIIKYLPLRIRNLFLNMEIGTIERIREIRLKVSCPILILFDDKIMSVSPKYRPTEPENGVVVYGEDVEYTYNMLTRESIYAFNDQIINCYITTDCGHRAGISGTAIVKNGIITGVKDVSGIYFRIAREHIGCSSRLLDKITKSNGIYNTVVAAPPGKGKTTLLRDAALTLSKNGYKISIIDERHEIAAQNCGYSSFDIGFCDVLDGFPKAEGIERAVRTLSPAIIVFDEIGNLKEAESVSYALNCGVNYITSVHASTLEELMKRPILKKLLEVDAVDVLALYNMGQIEDIRYIKGDRNVKNTCFELDLRNVRSDGAH